MRTSRILVKIIGFLCLMICFNCIMNVLLVPANSDIDVMWNQYYSKERNEIDTVIVGASQTYVGIDPAIIDSILGTSSFNMGTDSQSYTDSLMAIKIALSEHQIKNVILAVDYEYLFDENVNKKAEAAFSHSLASHMSMFDGFRQNLRFLINNIDEEVSINYFFPWITNHISISPGQLKENLYLRIGKIDLDNQGRDVNGFKPREGSLDFNNLGAAVTDANLSGKVSQEVNDALEEICDLCVENGTILTAVVTPVPKTVVVQYGSSYFDMVEYTSNLFGKYGYSLYDFNLLKDNCYEYDEKYFYDYAHLNEEGAYYFSELLGNTLLNEANNKESSGSYCCSSAEEFLEEMKCIDSVELVYKSIPGKGITLSCTTYADPKMILEYKYEMTDAEGNTSIIQDYSPNMQVCFTPQIDSACTYRVYVRQKGSSVEYDRYNEEKIVYWTN